MSSKPKPGLQPGKWGPQTGKPSDIKKDKMYAAMPPGKRVSQFGNTYYDYRANRSDKSQKKKI